MLLCFMILNDISNFWFSGFPKFLSIIKTETGSLYGNGTRTIVFLWRKWSRVIFSYTRPIFIRGKPLVRR